jgi:hypothetical protein
LLRYAPAAQMRFAATPFSFCLLMPYFSPLPLMPIDVMPFSDFHCLSPFAFAAMPPMPSGLRFSP